MLELAVIACLLSDPTNCHEETLVYMEEAVTPMQCMMGAMPELAKWQERRPRWFAKKWKCQPAGRFARI